MRTPALVILFFLYLFSAGLRAQHANEDFLYASAGKKDKLLESATLPPPVHTPSECCPHDNGESGECGTGKTFDGRSRCMAKTHPSTKAAVEVTLPKLRQIAFVHNTEAKEDVECSSGRFPYEDANYTLKNVYIIAAKREGDEDYHVIVSTKKKTPKPENLINVEISGLPYRDPNDDLKTVRKEFEERTPDMPDCDASYYFLPKRLKVNITGSLFFDNEHPCFPGGKRCNVGPKGYKPDNCWELHPVTAIKWLD